jgi:molybdenum cofactor cytidylyltransferase
VVTRTKEVKELCEARGIPVIFHEYPGRGDAVRLGMEQMMDLDGCMFCLCDQPFLGRKSINRMVGKFTYGEKTIFKLGYGEKQGTPGLFSNRYFEELCKLPEKSGGSHIIKKHLKEVDVIFAESEAELWDMDTKEDYDRMNQNRKN